MEMLAPRARPINKTRSPLQALQQISFPGKIKGGQYFLLSLYVVCKLFEMDVIFHDHCPSGAIVPT